jgi:hypothetical protein
VGWLQTVILLISAAPATKITGVCHRAQLIIYFLPKVKSKCYEKPPNTQGQQLNRKKKLYVLKAKWKFKVRQSVGMTEEKQIMSQKEN